ncbi:MAG: TetR/AcrR family transcriptional regulator [Gemmatimonadaceae bacterium]
MENREKILQAAADVYAEFGFRGATTRRIANAADVNEVTLFRIFGSKEALIAEAIKCSSLGIETPVLPDSPVNPEPELTLWATGHLARLRKRCPLMKTMMAELGERPEVCQSASEGPIRASEQLCSYVRALRSAGLAAADIHVETACAMLLGALFADAMGRDMMPSIFPQPAEAAPRLYSELFLRSIGVPKLARRRSTVGTRAAGKAAR